MRIEGEGRLARIFVGESDRHEGRPLYPAIVHMLREEGLAGATVPRGIEGFGAHSVVHTARVLRLSEDLPILIELVDRADRVRAVLPRIEAMVREGLVTLERVEVIAYRDGNEGPGTPDAENPASAGFSGGSSGRTRTCNPPVNSRMLYH